MIMDLNTIVSRYRENGFASGLPALSSDQVRSIRSCIEQLEMDYTEGAGGHSLNQFFRVNGHVVIPELAAMTGNPELNCLGSCWTKKSYRGLEMPGI